MARVSSAPLLVLVVAVAACILAGTPSPASAQSCTGANITLHEGQQQVINTTNTTTTNRKGKESLEFTNLFMVGEEGFEGVRLDVNGTDGTDGTQHTAWFPVKDQCFPDKQWQQVAVVVKINTNGNNLDFLLNDGSFRICRMSDAPASLHSLSVVAYGPSQWSLGMPRSSCATRNVNSEDDECALENLNTCSTPPTSTTTAPETAAQSCTGANITLHEGQQQVIYTTTKTTTYKKGKETLKFNKLFMVGEEGFEGVRLDVNGTHGTQHTAWFPVKDQCFPPDKQWQRVAAVVKINTNGNTLEFILNDGSLRKCTMSDAPASLHSLSVVAYGPSQWSSGMPMSSCKISFRFRSKDDECKLKDLNTCSTPPTTTTTTAAPETAKTPCTPKSAGLSQEMIMFIAAAWAVLVLVLVVVVVHCWL